MYFIEDGKQIENQQDLLDAIETAEFMREAGIPKPRWIDIDLNPDPRYKSNEVFRQAVGLVEGMGYEVRYKTLGPIATYAADHLVKV
jgi:predicted RNase H-related nuclease YkuK (DUF458 family)